jgi:hypothetical protein
MPLNFGDQNEKTGKKNHCSSRFESFLYNNIDFEHSLDTSWAILLFTNPQSRQLVLAHSIFRGRALNTPALYNIILTVPEPWIFKSTKNHKNHLAFNFANKIKLGLERRFKF